LVPMINMRLSTPHYLIDLNKIKELEYVKREEDQLVIGALTRHETVRTHELVQECCPLLSEGAKNIGHRQIRHRGTIGGSLVHADPTGEFPTIATALEAEFRIISPSGERTAVPEEFFLSGLLSAIEMDEILREIRFPISKPGSGWSYVEVSRTHGNLAVVGAGCLLNIEDGLIDEVCIGISNANPVPVKPREAESLLLGQEYSEEIITRAAEAAIEECEPESDLHASAEYRKELVRVLVKRALKEAYGRCQGVKRNGCS